MGLCVDPNPEFVTVVSQWDSTSPSFYEVTLCDFAYDIHGVDGPPGVYDDDMWQLPRDRHIMVELAEALACNEELKLYQDKVDEWCEHAIDAIEVELGALEDCSCPDDGWIAIHSNRVIAGEIAGVVYSRPIQYPDEDMQDNLDYMWRQWRVDRGAETEEMMRLMIRFECETNYHTYLSTPVDERKNNPKGTEWDHKQLSLMKERIQCRIHMIRDFPSGPHGYATGSSDYGLVHIGSSMRRMAESMGGRGGFMGTVAVSDVEIDKKTGRRTTLPLTLVWVDSNNAR